MTIIAATVIHREAPGCQYVGGSMHCYIHGVDEVGEGAYRICGECFHVFRTVEELLVAEKQQWRELADASLRPGWVGLPVTPPPPATDPDKIHFCPLCAHDF